ncbi:hypothetical protein [Sphingomonas sp. 28-63-12]|uniref:hypothetical protein n=1 Tax=Sphingomonas sp. 28-63-12 TaxID=1970434 RepID=UPI0035A844CD
MNDPWIRYFKMLLAVAVAWYGTAALFFAYDPLWGFAILPRNFAGWVGIGTIFFGLTARLVVDLQRTSNHD